MLAYLFLASQLAFPDPVGVDLSAALNFGFEPSGLASDGAQLVVVSDNGRFVVLDRDGTVLLQERDVGAEDFEGVTFAGRSDVLYIGVEEPDAIVELELASGEILRRFDLTAEMQGDANQGLEALTFRPIDGHPEGGVFFAGHQGEGRVYVWELPILSSSVDETAVFLTTIRPSIDFSDLAGLHWSDDDNALFSVFDSDDRLVMMTESGITLVEWALPGADQEGIALVGCDLFVAEDLSARLLRYRSPLCPAPVDAGPDVIDALLDGGADVFFDGSTFDGGTLDGGTFDGGEDASAIDAGADAPDAGRRDVTLPPPDGPVGLPGPPPACSCDATEQGAPVLWLALIAALWALGRRRR